MRQPTRALVESTMGRPVDDVRVHQDAGADAAARELQTPAFTLGKDIYFASGGYRPDTPAGLHVLGHEVAHALQARETAGPASSGDDAAEKEAGRAAFGLVHRQPTQVRATASAGVPHLFSTQEHEYIGGKVAGTTSTNIDIGTAAAPELLTFGQVMALGDYFPDLDELKKLTQTQDGKDQIRWARWRAQGKSGAEPAVSDTAKKEVMDRFFGVASQNVSHFSAGGTAASTYKEYHELALEKAFSAGVNDPVNRMMNQPVGAGLVNAKTIEAFGQHYLTDMFSAGHVRTPRSAIRTWYQTNHPDSVQKFIKHLAAHVHGHLTNLHPIADIFGQVPSLAEFEQKIEAMGGAAIKSFSLGDIVSLAYHDKDNQGLKVVSEVDEKGTKISGGYKFTAKGDNLLTTSPETEKMVIAAAKVSFAEVEAMYKEGEAKTPGRPSSTPGPQPNLQADYKAALAKMTPFGAEKYVPKEDPAGGNVKMSWQWGSFDTVMRSMVDASIKGAVASQLKEKAAGQSNAEVKAALESYVTDLENKGIEVVEAAVGKKAGP